MVKKLTITVEQDVYRGLHEVIGRGKISNFIEDLVRPHVLKPDLSAAYQQMAEDERREREAAAGDARRLLEEEVTRFVAELRAHDAGPAIRALRQQADAIRAQTVEQARRMLSSGKSAEEVLDYLANTLTNRLLHSPTQALRRASESADPALAQLLARLLAEERDRS